MDARDMLRRYIEQRREVGETELVLDGLHVDEVMRLLGAAGRTTISRTSPREGVPVSTTEHQDWRATLREAGVVDEVAKGDAPAPAVRDPGEDATQPAPRAGRLDFAPGSREEIPPEAAFRKGIVVGPVEAEIIPDLIARLPSLSAVAEKVQECRRCPLYATATNGVPGEGDPNAGLVCVGEAPGANEDATGRPFVGQAGQLLTRILAAIDLKREDVFIANVLKHRPPGNRNPRPEEVEACSPYLIRQLELIKPKVIVAFGTFAAQTLLQTKTPLGQLRGLVHRYHGTPLVVTYHPAALLRNPAWKRPTWEDVKLARRVLDSATGS
ncbi:MAG TPA: uracil-DNA glycosylase [Gemmatimonadaceae bacterium]|nr:uracil-DNA glycosylase [Gemmatimonadaceae bacterium]